MAILHTREQGLRVHGLANLGGLVAIAGLEEVEPPLLLGLLLELADRPIACRRSSPGGARR